MELLPLTPDDLLTTTRAVRRRLDLERPVEREVVDECLRIALQAPNGSNRQPWRWVVVDDPATRAAMADIWRRAMAGYVAELDEAREAGTLDTPPPAERQAEISQSVGHLSTHLHDVPVLVVPTIDGRMEDSGTYDQATRWGSVLPAVWSFMLALRARGLGSCWTTIHLHREEEMAELLGIPYGEVTQAGMFPVAHTIGTEFRPGARAASADVVHWNRW